MGAGGHIAAVPCRFIATIDNGAPLNVDGQLKIDQWAEAPSSIYTAGVALSTGAHEIRLEFVEYAGDASDRLT